MSSRGYVVLTLKFQRVGRRWTAYCEELGTATFGRSIPEADNKIKEAVLLHLNTLEEVGERGRFFTEHNIEFHHTKPKKDVTICLPLRPSVFIKSYIQPVREFCAV
jgi:hypothetical protein